MKVIGFKAAAKAQERDAFPNPFYKSVELNKECP